MVSIKDSLRRTTTGLVLMAAGMLHPVTGVAQEGDGAGESQRTDLLSLAQGVIPVALGGMAGELGVGMDHALQAMDGDGEGFVLTPKPGGALSTVVMVYKLPALTTFTDFAVPNVLETPSPSQTFFRNLTLAGSADGAEGPFVELARQSLTTHADKGQFTTFSALAEVPVRWLRLTLEGGIDIQRDKTFFEFSEIIGYGRQDPVPLSSGFQGKWKSRGMLLELQQDGASVSGCYDGEGDLRGVVSGNLLQATGRNRKSGVGSSFVLALDDANGIIGVRSTNRAPFKLYRGATAPAVVTECSARQIRPPGCGDTVYGIHFDFDSATIRVESAAILDALYTGLKDVAATTAITVTGHTSSEGSESYNAELSRRRATAVVDAIVARGLDPARIAAAGRGEIEPVADNATDSGRVLNRRVEILCQ